MPFRAGLLLSVVVATEPKIGYTEVKITSISFLRSVFHTILLSSLVCYLDSYFQPSLRGFVMIR